MHKKKVINFLGLLILTTGVSFGRARLSGYCEDGNKTVTTLGVASTTVVQKSYPSCQVAVYQQGTLTLASIYSDDSNTVQTNPFIAANTGFWFFYADNNSYDVRFSSGGIPTPFTHGALPIIDPQSIGGVRYADTFTGVDACVKIQSAISDLPGTGGVVDARGFQGSQPCSINPFSGVMVGVRLLLGATTYLTTAAWIVPTKSSVIGVGRGDPNSYSTTIKADSSFPTSTPLISLCSSPGPCYGVQVENLTIDCSSISGCTGGYNAYSQEQSWFRKVLVINAPAYGFWLDVGINATSATQNSGPYEDLEFVSNSAGTTGTVCFRALLVPAFRGINGITCNAYSYLSRPTNAIVIEASPTNVQNVHVEHFTNGVVLGTSLHGEFDTFVANVETGPDVLTAVIIGPTTTDTSQNIILVGIENSTAASNTLIDNVNTIVVNNVVGLGFYAIGNGGATTETVLTSRNDVRVNFQTNVRVLKNLAIPGTLNSDSDIALNNSGSAHINWHDSGVSGEPGLVIKTGTGANGHLGLLVQNTDATTPGAIGGGAYINGGGSTNGAGQGAYGAGYTGDMNTMIARSAGLGGMFVRDGVFDFLNAIGQTPGAATNPTSKFRVNTNGSAAFPTPVSFASLGSPANGTVAYCDNCTNQSNPCVGGGSGAIAKRLGGAWDCR